MAKPLQWERRDWRKPSGKIDSSTWHADLPGYDQLTQLYEIHNFDGEFFIFFTATAYKSRIGEDFATLETAQKAAQDHWDKFIAAAI